MKLSKSSKIIVINYFLYYNPYINHSQPLGQYRLLRRQASSGTQKPVHVPRPDAKGRSIRNNKIANKTVVLLWELIWLLVKLYHKNQGEILIFMPRFVLVNLS